MGHDKKTYLLYTSSVRLALCVAFGATAISAPAFSQAGPVESDDVIVVTGAPFGVTQRATTLATDVIDDQDLAVAPASSIGDLLNGRPGIRSTSFAPGASRPVIRGLSGPRVQVLANGTGLIDASSVSPDHQVAVHPGEAERIEVVRGPATLVYGGSAIGGVVNVIDGRIPTEVPEAGYAGIVSLQASSVDEGRSGFGRVTAGQGSFAFSLDAVRTRTEDYDIPAPAISQALADAESIGRGPAGTQVNSYSQLDAYGLGGSYIGDRGHLGASVKRTESEYGTVGEPDVFIQLEQTRYDVRGEYRFESGPFEALRGSVGQADYTHTEFEGPGEPGTVFNSDGFEGRLDLIQTRRDGWSAAYGVQALERSLEAIGDEAFLPGSDIEEAGVYTVQRIDLGGYGFEGGLRYDRRTLSAIPFGTTQRVERSFDSWSGSAAVFARLNEAVFVGLSLSQTERAPSEVELFADGVHVATGVYESGDLTLDTERVTTLEGTFHLDTDAFTGELHVYGARYDGFINEVPTGVDYVDDGESFPIFQFTQVDADFYGFEATGSYLLWAQDGRSLSLDGGLDVVRAETDSGPVPRIPPFSLTTGVTYATPRYELGAEVRHVGEQTRLADFELPTDAYTMLNLSGSIRPTGDESLTLFAEVRNLTDEEAREHASFLKDISTLPGRNFRAGLAWRF